MWHERVLELDDGSMSELKADSLACRIFGRKAFEVDALRRIYRQLYRVFQTFRQGQYRELVLGMSIVTKRVR